MNEHEGKRKKLTVDLSELVFEMELGDSMERRGYLDTETGEIIDMPDDIMRAVEDGETGSVLVDWDEELAETAEKILGDEKNRFLPIPKRESREGYEVMVSFSGTVEDRQLREKLDIALDGKGAFRRFRSVLDQRPDELERWYKFKDDWMRDEAIQWLLENGIEPVQVISGYFNDDGTEVNADLVPKPGLCLTCRKDDAGGTEEILCTLTRNDQKDEDDFECGAYEPKSGGHRGDAP
ncbi:MAG: UPF0158 family protein [Nitrospirota bacterium]